MPAPAKNERQALARYKEILQLSLSCVTKTIWLIAPRLNTEDQLALTTREDPVALSLEEGFHLHLRASQIFTVAEVGDSGWKVRTRSYIYSAGFRYREDDPVTFLAWHWHPENPATPTPHMHIHADHAIRRNVHKLHLPSGRVSFESVVRFVITELGVKAVRKDWDARLIKGENLYKSYRTWA